jgi:hypothetical protein
MPAEDVDRIMEQVVKVAPLTMGKYDSNAYQSPAGIERYRPLEGAPPQEPRTKFASARVSSR